MLRCFGGILRSPGEERSRLCELVGVVWLPDWLPTVSHRQHRPPGTFTFPEVFVFVVTDRPLIAELALKFDIQLEA